MTNIPRVTLVTVTHNSGPALREFWQPIPDESIEWVVVDNASTDDSVLVARQLGARVIELSKNVGFGAACNIGLDHSRSDVVAFVNPDVTVIYDDIPALCEAAMESNHLVAPQLVNADGSLQPNGRGVPSLPNKVLNRLRPSLASKRGFRVLTVEKEHRAVVWLTGAVVFAKKELLRRLEGFDESFFVYYEDVDLCLRARKLGIGSTVVGSCRWLHGWARAASGFNARAWKLEFGSALTFYRKYPELLFASEAPELG
ncbi:glycosyltransferase family 2 protein [Microbacterium sp. Leaf288]|uniref:glycosyltransferase family 2 protein n=1 Tax=Microbacterium sp. Leaf288 TaxID=1736323 RepID=UPI000AB442C5|nr:glycosyltransferase family 2 protein [Microbacterium sp. Leaf288]